MPPTPQGDCALGMVLSRSQQPSSSMVAMVYTKTRLAVGGALLSRKKCKEILCFIKTNTELVEVELSNAFSTGDTSRPDVFQQRLWAALLRHRALEGVTLLNTNCVPTHLSPSVLRATLLRLSITFCGADLGCMAWLRANFAHGGCLQTLVLSDNEMGDECVRLLCRVLRSNQTVTHLDISNNCFGRKGTRNVCKLLEGRGRHGSRGGGRAHPPTTPPEPGGGVVLKTLILECNMLGDAGGTMLAETLSAKNNTLNLLNIANNHMGPLGLASIATMLHYNSSITVLSVSNNTSNVSTQKHLHLALASNTTLHSLDVSRMSTEQATEDEDGHNGGDVGNYSAPAGGGAPPVDTGALIAAASRHIQYLRLDGMRTQMAQMCQIRQHLAQNTVLRRISLAACGLTLAMVYELAEGLRSNRTIEHVDLANNALCSTRAKPGPDRGGVLGGLGRGVLTLDERFWEVLGGNTTLRVLCLRGNSLGTQSMWHAADFLAQHKTLVALDVANNGIGSLGGLVMLHALGKNCHLQELNMHRNAVFPLSYTKLLVSVIKQRICADQSMPLQVHGIPFLITPREMRRFLRNRLHPAIRLTQADVLRAWAIDCRQRKEAFLLLTHPRLGSALFSRQLSVDTLRIILHFDILY